MHFLATVSEDALILFRLEILLRTLKKYAQTDFHFTTVFTGKQRTYGWAKDKMAVSHEGGMETIRKIAPYIAENSEILFCPYHYSFHPPCRWFVEPKSDPCIMIDADVLCCSALHSIEAMSKDRVRGLTAYGDHLTLEEWNKIGRWKEQDLQYYFNYGVVIVPNQFLRQIGDTLYDCMLEIEHKTPEKHRYYVGQIALAEAMNRLKTPRSTLSMKYNFADCVDVRYYRNEFDNVVFLHYFTNKYLLSGQDFMSKLSVETGNELHKFMKKVIAPVYPRITVL